jgi:hypothetical protein
MRENPQVSQSAAEDTWEEAVARLLEAPDGDLPIPIDCPSVSCMRCLCAVAESAFVTDVDVRSAGEGVVP